MSMNFSPLPVQINADHIMVFLKKETVDQLHWYLVSQGDTTTTYDTVIQEWVNWQKKADGMPDMPPLSSEKGVAKVVDRGIAEPPEIILEG